MKTYSTSNSDRSTASGRVSLKSLLTLASGAASMGAIDPSAQAAIVYTPFGSPQTVGFGSGQLSTYSWGLPDATTITLSRGQSKSSTLTTHRVLAMIDNGGVFGRQTNNRYSSSAGTNVAFRTNAGNNWDNAAPARNGSYAFGNIIRSRCFTASNANSLTGPGEFSDKYLLFKFDHAGQTQYGWVGMSGATYNAADMTEMSVTFTGWAYDDSGAVINAGDTVSVPEPSVASLMMAAMVVGASALRRRPKSQLAGSGQAH